jgi:hypothetical protein
VRSPVEAVRELDGTFLLAIYDCKSATLHLVSDRFGNFALHVYYDKAQLVFATQMSTVCAAIGRTSLDEIGLHQFIGIGHTLAGRTQFEGVHRLPSASLLTYTNGQITETQYYRPRYQVSVHASNNGALAREFAEYFESSTAMRVRGSLRTPSSLAASLSGGFDSRLVWAALLSLGVTKSVSAFTLGLLESNDMRIANSIAHRLGFRQLPISFTKQFLDETAKHWTSTIRLTEGGLSIEAATTMQAWQQQQHQYKVLLDGNGGALYRRQFMRSKRQKFSASEPRATTMLSLIKQPLIGSGLIRKEVEEAILLRSREALEQFFESSESIGTLSDQLDHYYTTVLSVNKYALSNNAQLNYLGVHQPLFNNRTYELVQQLPESMRMSNWVHRHVIHLLAPELEAFNIDNQGMWAPYRGFRFMRYPAVVYEKLLNSLGNANVRSALSLRRPLLDLQELMNRHRATLNEHIESGSPFLHTLLEPDVLHKVLKEYKTSNEAELRRLIQLADLAIWNKSI